jgi:hypothetical protein
MKKRDLFTELMAGVGDMQAQREGKITLREYQGEAKASPVVTSQELSSCAIGIICPMMYSPAAFGPNRPL